MGNFRINRPKVVADVFADEVVAVNFDTGRYYGLSGSALEVWKGLESHSAPADIASSLAARYSLDAIQLQSDIDSFLLRLLQEGLIAPDENRRHTVPAPLDLDPSVPWTIPELQIYDDMQDLLLLDPIHDVDETGWPSAKPTAPVPES